MAKVYQTYEQPWNAEAEQGLIGACLFMNDLFFAVSTTINPEMFYENIHGAAWRVISRHISQGGRVDTAVMFDTLSLHPHFETIGGMRYFVTLMERAVAEKGLIAAYADSIRANWIRRRIISVSLDAIDTAKNDPDADAMTMLSHLQETLMSVRGGKDEFTPISIGDAAAAVNKAIIDPSSDRLISTGLKRLDTVIGRMDRKELVLVAARPSMGKSALANCISLNVVENTGGKIGALVINGEMTEYQMARRYMTDLAFRLWRDDAPQYRKIRTRSLSVSEIGMLKEAETRLQHIPLRLLKRTGITMSQLRALIRAERMAMQDKGIDLGLVIVDHAGLVKVDNPRYGNKVAEQSEISAGLKEAADENDVVLMALNQLNRGVEAREDKRPQLSDLRDSGTWEQDADIVLGVYRDAYYAKRESEPKSEEKRLALLARQTSKTVEAIALKVREGDLGTAKLWGDMGRNAIRDHDPDFDETGAF